MGTRGPIPNRTEDLARDRSRQGVERTGGQDTTFGVMKDVRVPHPDKDWHPIAAMIYKAAKASGQADFYQQSDWAMLYSICDDISDYKKAGKRSSMMASVIYSALTPLMLTEGDRRRARLELQPKPSEGPSAELFAINGYKNELEDPDD